MDKEIFIAFATQKGGIGKTTLTVLTASYLHYVKGYNVAVVDCDAPQNSIADLRAREIKVIAESTYFKALACDHFRRVKKKAYPVVTSNAADALDDADKMLREEATKPDLVFFDLPGTLKSEGVVKTLSQMDYIFAPISADRLVVESTLQFAALFHENLITTGIAKTKGLHLFWTMVDGREKERAIRSLPANHQRHEYPHAGNPPAGQQAFSPRLVGGAQGDIPLDDIPDGQRPDERQ